MGHLTTAASVFAPHGRFDLGSPPHIARWFANGWPDDTLHAVNAAGTYPELPVRAGNTVWTVDNGATLHGFATNSTRTNPLLTRAEPAVVTPSAVQGTAIADVTISIQIWPSTLIGYRPPGT